MYNSAKCKCDTCNNFAISVYDDNGQIVDGDGYCFHHVKDKEAIYQQFRTYFKTHDKIVGVNASGFVIENGDLDNKKIYGCTFHHCKFINFHAINTRQRMCCYDYSEFINCDLKESNFQFCTMSGAKLEKVSFTGSDLICINFNGIKAKDTSFDDCDLYNSRFIKAELIDTSLTNCNVKKAVFYESLRENVSFKTSNTREALFERENKKVEKTIEAKEEVK